MSILSTIKSGFNGIFRPYQPPKPVYPAQPNGGGSWGNSQLPPMPRQPAARPAAPGLLPMSDGSRTSPGPQKQPPPTLNSVIKSQGFPVPSGQPVGSGAYHTPTLEELRAQNQARRPAAPAPAAPSSPAIPAVPGSYTAQLTTSDGQKINPATGGLVPGAAPGTLGGIDPSQAGIGNQDGNRPGAAGSIPTPPPPTLPTAPSYTPPTIPDQYGNDVSAAEKAYKESIGISPEEDAAQAEIDRIQEGTTLGLNKIRDQAIPMDFITGQGASLERRSLALQEPLDKKLARLQAKRTAALSASKFSLERADKRLDAATTSAQDLAKEQRTAQREQQKPTTLSPGETTGHYDANGTFVPGYTAPSTTKADHSPAYVEYLDAKNAGYKGTFEQYQVDDANRKAGANTGTRVLSANEAQALNVPFGTTAEQAYGKTPEKPLTESQGRDLTYANRGDEANGYINGLETQITSMNPIWFSTQAAIEPNAVGNAFVSPEIRQYRQAERNFLNAVLRRESGAVISPSEFKTGELQYFPRPGDDAKTLAQKKQNRETAIAAFRATASGQSANAAAGNAPHDELELNGVIYTNDGKGNYLPKGDGGAGKPAAAGPILQRVSIGGATIKVSKAIAQPLALAAAEFKRATGQDLKVVQSFRTRAQQEKLYRELKPKGARVAPPGKSFHETGMAIDVANWQAAEPYLRRHGLRNDLADDKNHFSIGETG